MPNGVLRDNDGSAVSWHTEEDHEAPGACLDRLQLFSFSVMDQGRPVRVIGFVYLICSPARPLAGARTAMPRRLIR